MAVVQIQMNKPEQVKRFALFNLGFRPFFLGAAIFAVLSIISWIAVYTSYSTIQTSNIIPSQWHAHEMLYGYGMAVVAGFLLTAVKNWTGIQTPHGKPLLALFALWCAARVLLLFGTAFLAWAALADLLFGLLLTVAIAYPIIKSRQWSQLAVVSKLLLLWIGNIVFYLGCYNLIDNGMLYALNGAVFLFVGLILMIGRRVIPFFIERGVAHIVTAKIQLKQHKWLDLSIMVLFIGLFLNEIFIQAAGLSSILALGLFALNGYRLFNWHVAALWRVSLLWSLYLSSLLINFGFLFYGLQGVLDIPSILTLHLFTIGGVGLMTIGMMSRVALGHTGRDIKSLSPWMALAFAAIAASAVFRIVLPLFAMQHYTSWVVISAIFWIIGFALFLLIYAPILCKPRVDGTYG
ncbi:MAG TPA: NnrS family protein [Methylotenera sp.]|nr:NnrS family protein [Methylotenera sp.]